VLEIVGAIAIIIKPVIVIVQIRTPIVVSVSCFSWRVVCCLTCCWSAVDGTLPAMRCALWRAEPGRLPV